MGDIVERLRFLGSGEPFRGALMCEAADEIERLRAELAAAKLNAERYRWLRDHLWAQSSTKIYVLPIVWNVDNRGRAGDNMDAAIDAAVKGDK